MRAHKQNVANYLKDQGGVNTTAGSANVQTVTLSEAIATTIPTGFTFRVKFGVTNTGAATLNVNSIGAKSVKVVTNGAAADPQAGDMLLGNYGTLLYDGTNLILLDPAQQARYAPGTLYGLTLSNNVSDATNDIDIAVGSARSSDDTTNIDLLTAMGKQLDVAWAVGGTPGATLGMLATGAAVTNTTYHIFLIKRPDTGVVDIAADTSVTGANIATNTNAAYTKIRRIGSILRESGAIVAFKQNGDEFLRTTPGADISSSGTTSAVTAALSVPTGIKVTARCRADVSNGSTIAGSIVIVTSPDETDRAPNGTGGDYNAQVPAVGVPQAFTVDVRTDTSRQIRYRAGNTTTTLRLATYGWVDTRGRI